MKFQDMIPNIVQGFEIEKGDIILVQLWGEDEHLPLLKKFCLEIAKSGGIPVQWQYSREYICEYFGSVSPEYLEFPDKFFKMFEHADMVIDLLTYSPAPKGMAEERIPFYGQYMQKLFQTLMQKKSFLQVKVPTRENAVMAGIDFDIFESTILKALDVDIAEIKANCNAMVERLTGVDQVHIYTTGERKLSFSLTNRNWVKDDGMGDIPSGEVYIAPIEESCNGEILIEEMYLNGEKLLDVVLTFEEGRLVKASSQELLEYIQSHPGDADRIAEFGIGLNPGVTELIGYPTTDEKMIGTAHIAVGMNAMFGGKNSSPLHMDFIFTPEKVEVDQAVVMQNGKLID